jgi:hypothetical protein
MVREFEYSPPVAWFAWIGCSISGILVAAWLSVVKVVLPYLAPVVSAALPAFTKKKGERVDPLVVQQIAELQEAVKGNNESIQALAKAIEASAKADDAAARQNRRLAVTALAVAAVSLVVALGAWLARF